MQNSNYLFEESGASEHDIPNEFSDEEFGSGNTSSPPHFFLDTFHNSDQKL